jgi:hypothetical protein
VDQGYLNEYGGRLTAETHTAQEAFKRAIAVGDPDATLEAQKKLTELQFASNKLEEAKRVQSRRKPPEQSSNSNNISSLSNNISNPRLGQILGLKSGRKRMNGLVTTTP